MDYIDKSRFEAFTDAIVAIAATIMILELGIPATNDFSGLIGERHIILAYIISFTMIYIVWSSHNQIFKKAEVITKKIVMINGLWIFVVTFVPFTTSWVGYAPDSFMPEFLYALNLLAWCIVFNLLDYQIRKDNPNINQNRYMNKIDTSIIYGGYLICMLVSIIKPVYSIYLIVLILIIRGIRMYIADDE